MGENSFEQLCINFLNEKLREFTTKRLIKEEMEYYTLEQVEVPQIDFLDNKYVIGIKWTQFCHYVIRMIQYRYNSLNLLFIFRFFQIYWSIRRMEYYPFWKTKQKNRSLLLIILLTESFKPVLRSPSLLYHRWSKMKRKNLQQNAS